MPFFNQSKWALEAGETKVTVTWSFAEFNYPEIAQNFSGYLNFESSINSSYRATIAKAFEAWEQVAAIDFVQVGDSASVDIRLGNRFIDGNPAPGQTSTLAIAKYWWSGAFTEKAQIYFDADAYGSGLYSTAVHEIGHTIGLAHATIQAAVMYPMLNSQNEAGILHADDIAGARSLYGTLTGGGTTPGATQMVAAVKTAYAGVLRLDLSDATASAVATQINGGQQTLSGYIGSLITQSANSTTPALVVYDAVMGATPTSTKLTELAAFCKGQAESPGYMATSDPRLGAFEAIGMGLAETTQFSAKFGALSDTAFISSAYLTAFGRTPTASQSQHFLNQNNYFEQLYRSVGISNSVADLRAKGAVLGQMYGYAVTEPTNAARADANAFIFDAADGVVTYGTPLGGFAFTGLVEDGYYGFFGL